MSKLSSPGFRGKVLLLSLLVMSLYFLSAAAGYAKEYGPDRDFRPDGGGQEYYGADSIRGGGYHGGGEDQSPPTISNWSPAELLFHIFLICQSLGLSL